ncbi:hypothetical protein DL96DRAFT_1788007 [Flagelloscypha sp. PMI_526]|nr:hypothetical protein DL96DRAFT_1788007 [Flagelloscypha sp. PMI_526]
MTPTSTSTETMLVPRPPQSQRLLQRIPACDDKEGHYIIVPDDFIFNNAPQSGFSDGTTSGKAMDAKTQNRVAIKIICAIPKYRDASKIEVDWYSNKKVILELWAAQRSTSDEETLSSDRAKQADLEVQHPDRAPGHKEGECKGGLAPEKRKNRPCAQVRKGIGAEKRRLIWKYNTLIKHLKKGQNVRIDGNGTRGCDEHTLPTELVRVFDKRQPKIPSSTESEKNSTTVGRIVVHIPSRRSSAFEPHNGISIRMQESPPMSDGPEKFLLQMGDHARPRTALDVNEQVSEEKELETGEEEQNGWSQRP